MRICMIVSYFALIIQKFILWVGIFKLDYFWIYDNLISNKVILKKIDDKGASLMYAHTILGNGKEF